MRKMPKRPIMDNIDSILPEDEIQTKVVNWAKNEALLRPELNLLYHIPNGGLRHPRVAATLKAMGVRSGIPDLHLPVARPIYYSGTNITKGYWHSLYIEMKRPTGKLNPEQKVIIPLLKQQGNYVAVCYDSESAIKTIQTYLDKPEELEVAE